MSYLNSTPGLPPEAEGSPPAKDRLEFRSCTEQIGQQFRELFERQSFIDGYLNRQTQAERNAIESIRRKNEERAKRKENDVVGELACKIIGAESVKEGQTRGRQWGEGLKRARAQLVSEGVPVVIGDLTSTIPFDRWQENTQAEAREESKEEMDTATSGLENARRQHELWLRNTASQFLGRLAEVSFQESLNNWGDAPALDDSIQHSGLIHFVEYRSDSEKDRLHKVPEAFSPDGFAQYTGRLMELVNEPQSESVKEALRLRGNGKERLLIMTQDNQYISAFREAASDPWRIITHIPDMQDKQWEKTKATMKDAEKQAKYYNKLEGEITEMPLQD